MKNEIAKHMSYSKEQYCSNFDNTYARLSLCYNCYTSLRSKQHDPLVSYILCDNIYHLLQRIEIDLSSKKRARVNRSIFSVRLADKKRPVMKAIDGLERSCALSERHAFILTRTLVSQSTNVMKSLKIQRPLFNQCIKTLDQGTTSSCPPILDQAQTTCHLMNGIAQFYSMCTITFGCIYIYVVVWSLKSTD